MNATKNNPASLGNHWIPNKYAGFCHYCSKRVEAKEGLAVKTHMDNGDTRGGWVVIHEICPKDETKPEPSEDFFSELQELYAKAEERGEQVFFGKSTPATTGKILAETAHYRLRVKKDVFLPHDPIGVMIAHKQKYQVARDEERLAARALNQFARNVN